jgi:hypothetical protein
MLQQYITSVIPQYCDLWKISAKSKSAETFRMEAKDFNGRSTATVTDKLIDGLISDV